LLLAKSMQEAAMLIENLEADNKKLQEQINTLKN
jgi:hypothetical protein